MSIAFETIPVPLRTDAEGVVRVGGTRVTLDTVIAAFKAGATAEDITQQYPVLHLADVYLIVGYYLRNPAIVDTYLEERAARAAEARKVIEAAPDWPAFVERLHVLRANRQTES